MTARRLAWIGRMFAVRDALLGAGAAHAVVTGQPLRPWLWAQAVADATDAAVLADAARRRQVSAAGFAAAAAATGAATAGALLRRV